MTDPKTPLSPKSGNPGLNDEIKKSVDNQSTVTPEQYPDRDLAMPDGGASADDR